MSYIKYAKPLIEAEIVGDVLKTINLYRVHYQIYCEVLDALAKFEGKQITKRIETHLNKVITKYRFSLTKEASLLYINVYQHKTSDKIVRIFIGYSDDPIYEKLKVAKHNTGMSHGLKQADIKEANLKNIGKLTDSYNFHLRALKSLVEESEKCGYDFIFDMIVNNR